MMPTKRRVVLFFIVLSLMLLAKYVWGQEEAVVGWDPQNCWDCQPNEALVLGFAAVFYGPIFGLIAGAIRVRKRNAAIRAGRLYAGEVISLGL